MTDLWYGTSGPRNARIAIVGESWGSEERYRRLPFVGRSGEENDKLLAESGLSRAEVFCTNVVSEQPPANDMWRFFYPTQVARSDNRECVRGLYPMPNVVEGLDRLRAQLAAVQPEVIIGYGNYTLWALSEGCFKVGDNKGRKVPTGITDWRGSQLYCREDMGGFRFMPTFHPAAVLRTWPWRYAIKHDLSRRLPKALRDEWDAPEREFIINPELDTVLRYLIMLLQDLNDGPVRLSADLETYGGHIDCLGLATSPKRAICIPFMSMLHPSGRWPEDDEYVIISTLRKVLTHPNVQLVGQNFLYDAQYFAFWWNILVRCHHDTMLMHHVCWPGTPMGLGYLSSLYCAYHRYWKDEGKVRQPGVPEEDRWNYNCKDVVSTLEISYEVDKLIVSLGLEVQAAVQMANFAMLLRVMLQGVRINTKVRAEVTIELAETIATYERRFDFLVPEETFPRDPKKKPWWRSPSQQSELFYDHLCIRATRSRSMKDADLERIGKMEPLLLPLTSALQEYRSLGVYHSTFCKARLDPDNKMRCSYNPTARTFRYKSSENAWGRGGNLQNIPKGTEED